MQSTQTKETIWTKPFVVLLVYETCMQIAHFVVMPITANYAVAVGATIAIGGLIASISSFAALALRFVSGSILSRAPIKPMLIISALLTMFASFAPGLIESLSVLTITRFLVGVSLVIKTTLIIVAAAYISPKAVLGRAVAMIGMGNVFALAVGPSIAINVGSAFGYPADFIISGIFFIGSVVSGFLLPDMGSKEAREQTGKQVGEQGVDVAAGDAADGDASAPIATVDVEPETRVEQPNEQGEAAPEPLDRYGYVRESSFKRLFNKQFNSSTLPLAGLAFLEAVIYSLITTLLVLMGEIRGFGDTSFFFIVYVIIVFAVRPFTSRLYDKYGFDRTCIPMAIFFALSLLSLVFTYDAKMLAFSAALFGLGQGCLWPCLQAETVRGVPNDRMALATNTFYFGVDTGFVLGPIVGGALLDVFGVTVTLAMGFVFSVILLIGSVFYGRAMGAQEQG